MAEEQKEQQPVVVLEVERNGVKLPFIEDVVKRGKEPQIIDGENQGGTKGLKYIRPHWKGVKPEDVLAWLGIEEVFNQLKPRINQNSQGLSFECMDETLDYSNSFDKEQFIESMKEFSARGMTIPEIRDEIMSLVDELTNLDFESEADIEKALSLKGRINKLKNDMQKKKRTTTADKEVTAEVA